MGFLNVKGEEKGGRGWLRELVLMSAHYLRISRDDTDLFNSVYLYISISTHILAQGPLMVNGHSCLEPTFWSQSTLLVS
jgi:hypothetical protein